MRAAARRELGGVGQQVRRRSASTRVGSASACGVGARRRSTSAPGPAPRRAAAPASTVDCTSVARSSGSLLQLQHAPADPRDVEQVVDQPHHVVELAVHRRRACARPSARGRIRRSSRSQPRAQRRERVAQLVGEHRQELVLLAGAPPAARTPSARARRCAPAPAPRASRSARPSSRVLRNSSAKTAILCRRICGLTGLVR